MTTMIGRAALKLRERYQHSAGKNWLCQQAEYKLSAAQAALLHSGAIRSAAIIGKNWLCQQAEYKLSAAQAALLHSGAIRGADVGLCTAGKLALPAQMALQHCRSKIRSSRRWPRERNSQASLSRGPPGWPETGR